MTSYNEKKEGNNRKKPNRLDEANDVQASDGEAEIENI